MTRDREFYKTMLVIALPAAFQGFISLLVVLVDNMMVASLGDTALASVALSNGVSVFFAAAMGGLVSGSAVLISQYWGKRDMDRIKRIFSIVLAFCLGLAAIFVLVIRLVPSGVLGLLTGDQNLVTSALPYFTLVCFSYLPMAVAVSLTGMLRSVEIVKVTLYTTILSLFANIGLNYIFIFGKLGMPAMGIQGAALATVIARSLELIIVWIYTFKVQKRLVLTPRDLLKGDRTLFLDYLKYGVPVGVTDAQWAIVGLCKASIIGHLGERMIASSNIAESLMNLGFVFTQSLAGGACVVIGKTVGAKRYDKTREYSKSIQLLFLAIGVTVAAAVFLLRAPFAALYTGVSPDAQGLAMQMIALGAITMIGTTYHASCFIGINRGAGDSRFVLMVDMICGWLVVLPVSYLAAFVFKLPLPIVFLLIRVDQLFKWIIAFFRLRGNKWIRNVTRDEPLNITD